jgi:hypothetical protein
MPIRDKDYTTLKLNVDVKNDWHTSTSIWVHFEGYGKCDGAVKVCGLHT